MPEILNTVVQGTPSTCTATADGLRELGRHAEQASNWTTGARGTAQTNWWGGAHEAFRMATDGIAPELDGLAAESRKTANSLDDFAGTLRVVDQKLAKARSVAKAGGVEVEGYLILAPTRPAMPKFGLAFASGPPQAATPLAAEMRAESQRYNAAVAEYNAQAEAYRKAKELFLEARKLEAEAHQELRGTMRETQESSNQFLTHLVVGTSQAAALVGSLEDGRRDAARILSRLEAQGNFWWKFASNELASPDFRETARQLGIHAANLTEEARTKLAQYEKYLKNVPPGVRNFLASNPAALLDLDGLGDHSPHGTRAAGKFVKAAPFAGAALAGLQEGHGVYTGEQTIQQAVVNTTADVVGGAAGAAAVARAVAGRHPVTQFLVGALGAATGSAELRHFAGEGLIESGIKAGQTPTVELSDARIQSIIDKVAAGDGIDGYDIENMSPEQFRKNFPYSLGSR